jgi:Zn-dependent protease with chaperone function
MEVYVLVRLLFLSVFVLFISGCASSSLKKHDVSQAAIEEEAKIQEKLAQEQLYKLRKRLQRVELKLAPQVRQLCSYLSDGQKGGCYFPVEVEDSQEINAFTNGEKVVFYSGIIKMLDKDEELAVVLGHEYAHAMLLHINKQKSNMLFGLLVDVLIAGTTGVDTGGTFSDIGAKAYSKDFELEADYAGLYLAHRAGYDISQAANVWRKMAIETGSATAKRYSSTHPSSPKRFIAQEHTYSEIIQKEIDGVALLPDKLDMTESEQADLDHYEPQKAVDEYKAITKRPKPKAQRVIGDYSIAAEDYAETTGCKSEDGGLVVGNMIKEEFGIETYEFGCAAGSVKIECEFGNCTKI